MTNTAKQHNVNHFWVYTEAGSYEAHDIRSGQFPSTSLVWAMNEASKHYDLQTGAKLQTAGYVWEVERFISSLDDVTVCYQFKKLEPVNYSKEA